MLFYIIGIVMELFKIDVGFWVYVVDGVFCIGGVLLFSGFMYVVVGLYMVCVYCLFDFGFI